MRKHVALISVCAVVAAVMSATIVHAGESVVQDLAIAQTRLGSYLAATPSQLLVSDPLGITPAVYGVPWANLTEAASVQVTLIKPGLNGVPLDGTGLFGAVVR